MDFYFIHSVVYFLYRPVPKLTLIFKNNLFYYCMLLVILYLMLCYTVFNALLHCIFFFHVLIYLYNCIYMYQGRIVLLNKSPFKSMDFGCTTWYI
jgi:hypothetical protein